MGCPSAFRIIPSLLVVAALVGTQGCAVVPAFKYPNAELTGDPAGPVGTFNASLNVPWQFDFSNVSVVQAADCRRFLTTNELPAANAISPCEGIPRDKNFVALTLSGGGGRSAGLSAAVMWELRQRGILRHVDVISAVSGGAQAAALYALMRDPEDVDELSQSEQRYVLNHSDSDNFVDIFGGNLTGDWSASLFVPWHLFPFFFTYYDRTDGTVHLICLVFPERSPTSHSLEGHSNR